MEKVRKPAKRITLNECAVNTSIRFKKKNKPEKTQVKDLDSQSVRKSN